MKTVFPILLFIGLVPFLSLAQKEKTERTTFYIVSLPSEKLSEDFLTYSVNFYGSGLSAAGLTGKNCEDQISMDAFKRMEGESQYGHLRVRAYMGYVKRGDLERKKEKHVEKDKETGEETVSYTYWEYPV